MRRSLLVSLLFLLPACASRNSPAPADSSRVQATIVGVPQAVVLERSPCFGSCPVYTVAVSPDGAVTYQGRAHVRRVGAAEARVSRDQVTALLNELDRAGFFTFANRYVQGEPACGRYVTDSPSATTTVTYRGRTKSVVHDYGCGSAPGALVVLERRIDEVLGTGKWTGR
ncbi:MAG TPA: DUF6438 domain-containing protein [Gemmatimonadales bacterium]